MYDYFKIVLKAVVFKITTDSSQTSKTVFGNQLYNVITRKNTKTKLQKKKMLRIDS